MKTKYVLNSGGIRKSLEKRQKFFNEIVKGLGNKPKLLIVLFALPREVWENKFAEYETMMNESAPEGIKAQFELAMPADFKQQVARCDVVYMHGGDDNLIKYWLEKLNVPEVWQGKVVAGSSAGADVLVKHFWTCDWRQILDGLDIVPIKFIPHYKSDYGNDDPYRGEINWDNAYKDLANHGNKNLPIHALEEGDFIVFEI